MARVAGWQDGSLSLMGNAIDFFWASIQKHQMMLSKNKKEMTYSNNKS